MLTSLQAGDQCYCGNSYGKWGLPDNAETLCNWECDGDTTQFCGSWSSHFVYKLTDGRWGWVCVRVCASE